MPDFLKEVCSSFEEIHYFVGGISVGLILGIAITLVVVHLVIKSINKKND